MRPETRYAKSGDLHIAYQVIGDGPIDLVYVPGFVSHLEVYWEEPIVAAYFTRLARFSRLIVLDKRGSGMSDRVPIDQLPTLEVRMDDVRAVMDAVGTERAAVMGTSEGGPMAALFAATYPDRALALVLYATYPRAIKDDEFPEGWLAPKDAAGDAEWIEKTWTEGAFDSIPEGFAEGLTPEEQERVARWWGRLCRSSVSPGAAIALSRMGNEVDIRHVLPSIRVPTLAIVRGGDENAPATRYMAEHVPGARFVELPGSAHTPFFGPQEPLIAEIEEFLTGVRPAPEYDRVLATVLFTDIVGSTELAERLGDRRWAELLGAHHGAVREQLERFRGREVDTAGDGFLATFDGPARAIRCACAIRDSVAALGLQVRAGLHTGECELVEGKVRGIAVHTGARVASIAAPGEVLASSTVKDLVAGSGISFADRGVHALKGIPGEWRVFAVVNGV
ncbi:MAG: adenylate/guanylate cyclase domain-containing protein [Actinomycetota bacterium]|nr:adenylate/guanylate cyclase domain-containing protein [Actinomycetota bacterium]